MEIDALNTELEKLGELRAQLNDCRGRIALKEKEFKRVNIELFRQLSQLEADVCLAEGRIKSLATSIQSAIQFYTQLESSYLGTVFAVWTKLKSRLRANREEANVLGYVGSYFRFRR